MIFFSVLFSFFIRRVFVLKRGTKIAAHDIQKRYTHPLTAETKKLSKKIYKRQPLPQREPTQSTKLINVEGPSFINILVSNHNKYTKEPSSLGMDSTSSSKQFYFLPSKLSKKCIKDLLSKLSCSFYPQKTHSNSKMFP